MKTIAYHILDIVHNSVRANASIIEIEVCENKNENVFRFRIKDDGDGIDEEALKRISDPFYTTRTTRKVGMGIALLKHHFELSNGSVELNSQQGVGTELVAWCEHDHFDRQPLGDIASTVSGLCTTIPQCDFVYRHSTPLGDFVLDTREVKQTLEDIPITHPAVSNFLKEMLQENLRELQADSY